ncbi:MAG: DNA-3-methyladenine glycosylase [Verrucomicrobiales bacterium]|jgi:DNA-3-methyladenine glycosylase
MLPREFFERDPVTCARELIGKIFTWNGCSGRIVETEAYSEKNDEAAHLHFRPSSREFLADHKPGAAYVYLNYGMYWLSNVLIKGETNGFVLFRALEPLEGISKMQKRRKREKLTDLCSGPGKICMALAMNGDDHGGSFVKSPKRCFREPTPDEQLLTEIEIETDVRIGISRAVDLPWRFLAKGSKHVSKPVLKPRKKK